MQTQALPLEALEQGVMNAKERLSGLVHHLSNESQYTSITYNDKLAQWGIKPSTGALMPIWVLTPISSPSLIRKPERFSYRSGSSLGLQHFVLRAVSSLSLASKLAVRARHGGPRGTRTPDIHGVNVTL